MKRSIDTGGILQFVTGIREQSPVIFLETCLKETVDENDLRMAVEKALDVFPVFQVKLVFDSAEKKPVYEKNENSPAVYPYDQASHFFGEESNGYLFRVYFREKRIILSIHHMLTDFQGADNFLRCILSFYFGLDGRTALTVDPEDGRDPFLLYGDRSTVGFSMKNRWTNELTIPNHMAYRRGEGCTVHKLVFPVSELLICSKRAESSVFPLMSWLMAKAIAREYGSEDKMIIGSGAFNCRSLYGSKTPKCFSHSFITMLHPRERTMDLDRQLTIQRARMELELDSETVTGEIASRREAAELLMSDFARTVQDQVAFDLKRRKNAQNISFFNSYAGRIDFSNEMAPFIESVDYLLSVTRNPIQAASFSREGFLYCNIEEVGFQKSIAPAVLDIARENGITGSASEPFVMHFDSYPMEELFQ